MDFGSVKSVTVPEGVVKKISRTDTALWKDGYKNMVGYSTEADGVTAYNGGLGYKEGYRIRSGGAEGAHNNATCTGYIRVRGGDVVRLSGWNFYYANNGNAINAYDGTLANIGQFTFLPAEYGIFAANSAYHAYSLESVTEEKPGVYKWTVPPSSSGVSYIRVSGMTFGGGDGMIITLNEEVG